MGRKETVSVTIWSPGKNNTDVIKGRCLGLITPEEFCCLIKKPSVVQKVITSETVPLDHISEVPIDEISGTRLMIAMGERNDEQLPSKHIFITQSIEYLSYSNIAAKEVSLSCKDAYIELKAEAE